MNRSSRRRGQEPRNPHIAKLLQGALEGSPEAWDALVREFTSLIYGTARRTGLSGDEAEDVAQMTWMALLRRGHAIRDPQSLPKWLAVTARRIASRRLQKLQTEITPVPEDLEADLTGADDLLVEEERAEAVRAALENLPEPCRTLLTLLFAEASPNYRTVAKALSMPLGSIGPTRARCLARLHRLLRRKGLEP